MRVTPLRGGKTSKQATTTTIAKQQKHDAMKCILLGFQITNRKTNTWNRQKTATSLEGIFLTVQSQDNYL